MGNRKNLKKMQLDAWDTYRLRCNLLETLSILEMITDAVLDAAYETAVEMYYDVWRTNKK